MYLAHIQELATGLRCSIDQTDIIAPVYMPDMHMAIMPMTIDDAAYAAALHELGHAADRYRCTHDSYRANPIPWECRAWQWAIEHASVWSPAMQRELESALAEWTEHAARYRTDRNIVAVDATVATGRQRMTVDRGNL